MSAKIELTQKQLDTVHRFIDNNSLQEFAQFRHSLPTEYKSISSLTVDEVAKILYQKGSYNIGSKYKVGDWAVDTEQNITARITSVGKDESVYWVDDANSSCFCFENTRHATPEEITTEKERRFWAGVGRKIGEFRIGDIRILDDGNSVHITDIDYARAKYIQGTLKGFYPAESFIKFEF